MGRKINTYIVKDIIEGKEYRVNSHDEVAKIVGRSKSYSMAAMVMGKIVAGRYEILKEGEE